MNLGLNSMLGMLAFYYWDAALCVGLPLIGFLLWRAFPPARGPWGSPRQGERDPGDIRTLESGLQEALEDAGRAAELAGSSVAAGLGGPVAEALTHSNETVEFLDPPALRPREIVGNMKRRFILWLAQGFGSGRVPFAPGTLGTVVGLGWFVLLLVPGNPWLFLTLAVAGIWLSVPLCGEAEKILGEKDPSSVVLDEIVAVPLCFVSWLGSELASSGVLPGPGFLFASQTWPWTLGILAAFRFFDILKPWPVRQSQRLPGGWGVVADDVLAAVYVNGVTLLVLGGRMLLR
jgi:phosphatidylglycerophosphatase A